MKLVPEVKMEVDSRDEDTVDTVTGVIYLPILCWKKRSAMQAEQSR